MSEMPLSEGDMATSATAPGAAGSTRRRSACALSCMARNPQARQRTTVVPSADRQPPERGGCLDGRGEPGSLGSGQPPGLPQRGEELTNRPATASLAYRPRCLTRARAGGGRFSGWFRCNHCTRGCIRCTPFEWLSQSSPVPCLFAAATPRSLRSSRTRLRSKSQPWGRQSARLIRAATMSGRTVRWMMP